jgi:hypothetical protein
MMGVGRVWFPFRSKNEIQLGEIAGGCSKISRISKDQPINAWGIHLLFGPALFLALPHLDGKA